MVSCIVQFLYPYFSKEEFKKFWLLALAFFFTIGSYWLLRLLKDVVLYKFAFPVTLGWPVGYGREMVPFIKTLSPLVVMTTVAFYSKLVDMFEKQTLFYGIVGTYGFIFSCLACVFALTENYGPHTIGALPLAAAGMLAYLATESFGSIVVVLFWSFTVSSTKTDEAKRGFPFIIAFGQLGGIMGSSLMLISNLPVWPLYAAAVVLMSGIIVVIHRLVATIPKTELISQKLEKKTAPDIFAGLRLLVTRPYLLGILVVSTFYEVAKFIVDYQMKSQAAVIEGFDFTRFMGIYGVTTNVLSFLMVLFGTRYMMKRFGLRVCLLISPLVFGSALLGLYCFYQTNPETITLLWATFGAMSLVTATSYAVNNPVKEMMYIPTSKDAQFKTKGIIDMFGSRVAKMTGARVGQLLNVAGDPLLSITNLMVYGSFCSLGIIGVWIAVAFYVGQKNAALLKSGEIVQ